MNLMYVMWHPNLGRVDLGGTLVFVFEDCRVEVEQRQNGWWMWEDGSGLPIMAGRRNQKEVEEYLAERMGVNGG